MSNFIVNGNVIKYSYSGATSLHLGHYSDVLLNANPSEVIIQVGTNDLVGSNRRDVDNDQIASDIIDIGIKCKASGVKKVYISSIFLHETLMPIKGRRL